MKAPFFKLNGKRFHDEPITKMQILSGLLFAITGVRTAIYRQTARTRAQAWAIHAASIQNELDEQRANGYGYCYLTGERIAL